MTAKNWLRRTLPKILKKKMFSTYESNRKIMKAKPRSTVFFLASKGFRTPQRTRINEENNNLNKASSTPKISASNRNRQNRDIQTTCFSRYSNEHNKNFMNRNLRKKSRCTQPKLLTLFIDIDNELQQEAKMANT